MAVLYAFFRLTDDLADQPGELLHKRQALQEWRLGLRAAISGEFRHPIHPALAQVVHRYSVPVLHLENVIDGVGQDLEPVRFPNFAALYQYCYRVASAVGLSCLPVWGLANSAAPSQVRGPAEAAGIAFQLTNILRDLPEDYQQGRVYLPCDELKQFGCSPNRWHEPENREAFDTMMRFQVNRAKEYYRQSEALTELLSADGRAIFSVMSGLYHQLLSEIERRRFDVFTERVRVPKRAKLKFLLRAFAMKWGWR